MTAMMVNCFQEPVELVLVRPVWADQQINFNGPFELELDRSFCHSGCLVVVPKFLFEEFSKWNQPFLEYPVPFFKDIVTCKTCSPS